MAEFKLTNEIIYKNLVLIDESGDKGVHVSNFIHDSGAKLSESDSSDLIAYLLKYDLVEIEDTDDIYFLTDVGYNVLESDGWHDPELNLYDDEPIDRSLNYSVVGSEDKKEKKPRQVSWFMQWLIISALVGAVTLYISGGRDQEEEFPFNDAILESIKIELDSVNGSNGPVYRIEPTE